MDAETDYSRAIELMRTHFASAPGKIGVDDLFNKLRSEMSVNNSDALRHARRWLTQNGEIEFRWHGGDVPSLGATSRLKAPPRSRP